MAPGARVITSIGDGKLSETTLASFFAPSACNDYDSLYTKHKLAWRINLHSMARAAFQHTAPTYLACSSGQTWDETDAVFLLHCTALPGLANLKHQAGSDQPMAEL